MDGLDEVDALVFLGCEPEPGEIVKGRARAADDDPFGQGKQPLWFAPGVQGEEAVGTCKVEERGGRHLAAEAGERIYGVVGSAVAAGSVEGGGLEAGIGLAGQPDHRQPVGEGGGRAAFLERLGANRSEEHGGEPEGVRGGLCDGEMATVGGIEGSAEES